MQKQLEKMKTNISYIYQFAIDDFKTKYAGSALGMMWAFLQPIVTVVIYWFVFQIGFKNQAVGEYPFILWLVSGLAPWFFFSDSISNAVTSLVDYSYLVKKVVFNIQILPIIRIVSVFLVQILVLLFTGVLFVCYGFFPRFKWLQVIYYIIYTFVLGMGIVYFASALYVFFRDVIQVVTILLQIVFWTTPVVWQFDIFDEKIQNILSRNPFFYPVRGYRDALMDGNWFWEYEIGENVYYWIVAVLCLIIGYSIFKKLKPHFADVL